jgi:hypothetical protein
LSIFKENFRKLALDLLVLEEFFDVVWQELREFVDCEQKAHIIHLRNLDRSVFLFLWGTGLERYSRARRFIYVSRGCFLFFFVGLFSFMLFIK